MEVHQISESGMLARQALCNLLGRFLPRNEALLRVSNVLKVY